MSGLIVTIKLMKVHDLLHYKDISYHILT